jgi:hypothetical protein
MNAEWVPEGAMLRKPRILEAARITAKCFLKNGIPFQINVMKLKCQIKGLSLDISLRKVITSELPRLEES